MSLGDAAGDGTRQHLRGRSDTELQHNDGQPIFEWTVRESRLVSARVLGMHGFALKFAGLVLVGCLLACNGTKQATDSGTDSFDGGGAAGATAPDGAGGAGGVATPTGDAGSPLGSGGSADFASRYTAVFCQVFVRCGVSPSVAACKADYIDTGAFNLTALFQDIDSGTTIYDASRADPCFNAMANEPCTVSGASSGHQLDAVCAGVLKGTVADGGSCVADTECAAGICRQPNCNASCCLGTCGQLSPVGAACYSSSDCASDAACVYDYLSSSSQGTCQLGVGQGQPCITGTECQSGLTCDFDSAGTGTCAPYVKDGEVCTADGPVCENLNSFCDPQSGKCRPRLAVGSACSVPSGSLSRPGAGCVFWADCVSGTCVALPGAGEACTVPDGGSGALVCRAGDCIGGVCQPTVLAPPCTLATAATPDAGARD